MTLTEATNLEAGTIVENFEILKRISDGYLVFYFEDAHNVYNPKFVPFEDFVERDYEINTDDWVKEGIFNESHIKHVDDHGFCRYKE